MRLISCLFALLLALAASPGPRAELPLPDATIYGMLATPSGAPVGAGALVARVVRAGSPVLEADGRFVQADGDFWFVVNIPLETNIGAPGPSGLAAREGDVVSVLMVSGKVVQLGASIPPLAAGLAIRADGVVDAPVGTTYIRGDCSPDLRLSITDGIRVLNYLFIAPDPPPCLEACDSDGNGTLNITDGISLLSFLFLGGPAPPEPGPACGPDESPTELGCITSACEA